MNKIWLIIITALFAMTGCVTDDSDSEDGISTDLVSNPMSASGESDSKVIMTFENTKYDFGKIIQGEKITYSYRFENSGNEPLIITSVGASCGCTVPTWDKAPIPPGETGKIDVVFDSEGRTGTQSKDITIISNAVPNTTVVRLTGEVLVP